MIMLFKKSGTIKQREKLEKIRKKPNKKKCKKKCDWRKKHICKIKKEKQCGKHLEFFLFIKISIFGQVYILFLFP